MSWKALNMIIFSIIIIMITLPDLFDSVSTHMQCSRLAATVEMAGDSHAQTPQEG